jgi:5-methylcytosine-specific restriction protein A
MTTGTLKPCLSCGELSPNSRCGSHRLRDTRTNRGRRGRDKGWDKISKRARAMTDVCSDAHLGGCSGQLEADHRPSAWDRKAKGLPLRLGVDVDVVCAAHNRLRGPARGPSVTRQD